MIEDARDQGVDLTLFSDACQFLQGTARIVRADNGDVIDPAARFTGWERPLENLQVLLNAGLRASNGRLVDRIRQTFIQQSGRYPITVAAHGNADNAWTFCQVIMNDYVGPLVVDFNNCVIELEADDEDTELHEPMLFGALETLHQVLTSDTKVKCALTDVCYKNAAHLTDTNCTTRPWLRPRNSPPCWYDRLHIALGLHNVEFDP
jgi:hypothetical protein